MNADKIVLEVRGMQFPSKKNRHYQGRNGRILIDKKVSERLRKIEAVIVCELLSKCQTNGNAMPTECLPPAWIALLTGSKKFDDSWDIIPEIIVKCETCEIGSEGAVIELELIN